MLQKHPHVIFESRIKTNKGCANAGNLEWRSFRRAKHLSNLVEAANRRFRRDVAEATKYIETALVIDKAMVIMFFFIIYIIISMLTSIKY